MTDFSKQQRPHRGLMSGAGVRCDDTTCWCHAWAEGPISSNLVADLRSWIESDSGHKFWRGQRSMSQACFEAADEIERLRAALERILKGPWPGDLEGAEDQCRFDAMIARNALSGDSSVVETKATPAGVLQWAIDSFGPIARNRDERAARLVEEAMEVAQVEGVPLETLKRIADRIYSRPVGDLGQEVGGLGITLYALAANCGLNLFGEIEREWKRVLSKPRDWWQRKHAEKVAAGTANLSPAETSEQT